MVRLSEMPVAVQVGRGRAEVLCPKSQTCAIMSEASVNPSPSRFGLLCKCTEHSQKYM